MDNKAVDIKTDTRNTNIDSMKGILIILVVLGHTYNKYCYGFISLFLVGLFIPLFISSILTNSKFCKTVLKC